MSPQRRVFDIFEWRTIPYRTLRFWLIVVGAIIILVGIWLVNKYGLPIGDQNKDFGLEKRKAGFTYIDGDVRVKTYEATDWVPAEKVKDLYPGDLVRTNSNSSCQIAFFDGTVYEVKPNSLISILESYEDRVTQKRQVNVEITTGALDLSTVQRNTPQSRAKVETPNAVADVGPYTRAHAKYDDKMKDSQFKISAGDAQISIRDTDRTMSAAANEEVKVGGGALEKRSLPSPPILIAPRNSEVFTSNQPEKLKIQLAWQVANPKYSFRVSVSTHPQFYQITYEEVIPNRGEVDITGLKHNTYYWRVVAINEYNMESPWSAVSMFAIRPMKVNKSTEIRFKINETKIYGNILEIIGETDPDNMVTINNRIVLVEKDGTFKHFTEPFERTNTAELNIQVKDYSGAVQEFKHRVKLR